MSTLGVVIAIGWFFIPLSKKICAWVRYTNADNVQFPVQAFIAAVGFWCAAVWCIALGPISTRILAGIICYYIWSTIDDWMMRSEV